MLDRSFYTRSTLIVAQELLGKYLVFEDKVGQIVETEAYLGPEDLASHARFKSKKRNHLMFGEGGIVYVYFTYGMHYMLNIVACEKGEAGAVLIRAIKPIENLEGKVDGPAKLTKAYGIGREHNGLDATQKPLYVLEGGKVEVEATARIGIDYAGEYRDKPWRFVRKFTTEVTENTEKKRKILGSY